MSRNTLAAAAFALLSACASAQTPPPGGWSGAAPPAGGSSLEFTPAPRDVVDVGATSAWRMVAKPSDTYSVWINLPGKARAGDVVTFRLVYVFAKGEVFEDDKEVGWQDYPGVTVNCKAEEVRMGQRRAYHGDGEMVLDMDQNVFTPIGPDSPIEAAANARCKGQFAVGDVTVPDGPAWIDAARAKAAGVREDT